MSLLGPYRSGLYGWRCEANVITPKVGMFDEPEECGTEGEVRFELEHFDDEPEDDCSGCGHHLVASHDNFYEIEEKIQRGKSSPSDAWI